LYISNAALGSGLYDLGDCPRRHDLDTTELLDVEQMLIAGDGILDVPRDRGFKELVASQSPLEFAAERLDSTSYK